jgi:hypothetical protein
MTPNRITLDELHLIVRIPAGLSNDALAACRRVIVSFRFARQLRRVVQRFVRSHPALRPVTVRIAR